VAVEVVEVVAQPQATVLLVVVVLAVIVKN
jgi:hypothetical protein